MAANQGKDMTGLEICHSANTKEITESDKDHQCMCKRLLGNRLFT